LTSAYPLVAAVMIEPFVEMSTFRLIVMAGVLG
jgi:hypothetical protein